MKASQLIKALQIVIEEHGDLAVGYLDDREGYLLVEEVHFRLPQAGPWGRYTPPFLEIVGGWNLFLGDKPTPTVSPYPLE